MATQTRPFTKEGINQLKADKPVTYEIIDSNGDSVYIGHAKRGRVHDRLEEHLPGSRGAMLGGRKVKIIQRESMDEAYAAEKRLIRDKQPTLNWRHK